MSLDYSSRVSTPRRVINPEEIQRRQINNAVDAAIRQANTQHQRDLAVLKSQHEKEQQRLNQRLNSLNSQFADSIRRHQKQLCDMREQFDVRLNNAIADTERKRQQDRIDAERKRQQDRIKYEEELNEAVDIINANVDDLRQSTQKALNETNENIRTLRLETQKQLNQQQSQINSIVDEVHNDKAKAVATKLALRAAYNELLSILQLKEHEKYVPKELAAINARLGNLDSLPDVAACAVLNTEFNNLLTLDADLEEAKMMYETKHLLTLKAAEEVLARMNENRNRVSLTDEDGNVAKNEKGEIVKIELDFWTEDKYGELEKDLMSIIEQVTNGLYDPNYTTEDLDKALQMIQNIDQQQNELVIESIKSGNASQIRAEMADAIIEHLEGQRFQVIERGYENGDARNAYFIKLDDGTSEIVVVVNPESSENNLVIRRTVDTDLSEPGLIQMNEDIDKVLQEAGLCTSGGGCRQHNANTDNAWQEIYDMDVVQQAIPSETKERARLRDIRKKRNGNNQ